MALTIDAYSAFLAYAHTAQGRARLAADGNPGNEIAAACQRGGDTDPSLYLKVLLVDLDGNKIMHVAKGVLG